MGPRKPHAAPFLKARDFFQTSPRFLEGAGVASLLLFFFLLQIRDLYSPGFIWDGLHTEGWAVTLHGWLQRHSFFDLLVGGRLPTTFASPYHGVLMTYLFLPFLHVFGPSWTFVRLWPVFFALLTLFFTYLFARETFNRRTALLGLSLAVLHPPFVMGVKTGSTYHSFVSAFSMGALLFFSRWWRRRKSSDLYAGLFLLGSGLSTVSWFSWFAGALFAAAVPFALTDPGLRALPAAPSRTIRVGLTGCLVFLGSLWLVLYRELLSGFASVQFFVGSLFVTKGADGPLDSFVLRLGHSLQTFQRLLTGSEMFRAQLDAPFRLADGWYPFLVGGAVVLNLWPGPRPARYLTGMVVCMGVLTVFSPSISSGFDNTLAFFFYPFPQLILAMALDRLFFLFKRWKQAGWVLALCLLPLGFRQAAGLAEYFHRLETGGGRRVYSDSVYALADWLLAGRQGAHPVVVLNHELLHHLWFLAPGVRLTPMLSLDAGTPVQERRRLLKEFVLEKVPVGGCLVRHVYGSSYNEFNFPVLQEVLADTNRAPRLVRDFRDPDGEVVFEVYALEADLGPKINVRREARLAEEGI